MMTEKMVSEREAVKREREAFRNGARWLFAKREAPMQLGIYIDEPTQDAFIADRYPLPKVTRQRVESDPHAGSARDWDQVWRCEAGKIQWRGASKDWKNLQPNISARLDGGYDINSVTEQRARLWADLLARPTKEVEDDS